MPCLQSQLESAVVYVFEIEPENADHSAEGTLIRQQ